MKISVIIPSYNGAASLPKLVNALLKQTHVPEEIIVVIDGSSDDSVAVLATRYSDESRLKVIEQENQGRSATRNRGAKEAHGELLVFFDDDIKPESGCIQAHLNWHTKNPHTIVSGALLEPKSLNKSDIENYKAVLASKWETGLISGAPMTKSNIYLSAANFSVSASTFHDLTGFNPKLPDAEDLDLAIRAIESGINVFYLAQARAFHEDPLTCKTYIHRQRQYAKAHQQLLKLNSTYRNIHQARSRIRNFRLKKVIYGFFAFPCWVSAIDNEKLHFLPQKIRYKIYTLVIAALSVYYPHIKLKRTDS